MWQYETTVSWTSDKEGRLHAGGNPEIIIATPPEFGGPKNRWTPEDLLAGAVGSCVMTSSIFFLEKGGVKLLSFLSNATAIMEKTREGLAITEISVDVRIAVANEEDIEKAYSAMQKAEATCPVSKALKCGVSLKTSVTCPAS
ncbi:MAG: OsmC family protein [Acidobacteriota bacterium]